MTLVVKGAAPNGQDAIVGTRPSDGAEHEPIEVTPIDTIPDIVRRARAAAEAHAKRSIDERAMLLSEAADAVLSDGKHLVDLIVAETGKPRAEAWLHEVAPTAELGKHWSEEGPSLLAPHPVSLDPLSYPKKTAIVERVPRGVLGLITPWNFPLAIPLRTIFPALLVGDAVVLKPSEYTPRIAHRLGCLLREVYGPHLVSVVVGEGAAGAALIDAGVDAVSFTGSVATGRKVGAHAGQSLVPVALELGGKDAAIVCEDAAIERTCRGLVWGAFANTGQNCAAIERVYVHRRVAQQVTARVVELVEALEPVRDFGPLTTEAQRAIVERHVTGARDAGVKIACGGARLDRDGLWFAPTVLEDPDESLEVIQEESFGPLMPIMLVDSDQEAVERANDSRFGLTGSVWTSDLHKGRALARSLKAGVVTVNNHAFTGSVPSLPWGGVGATGFGVTNSHFALDVLTRPRAVVVDGYRKPELYWHPYGEGLERVGERVAAFARAKGVRKLPALARLVSALRKR